MSKLEGTIVEAILDKKGEGTVSLDLSGFDGAIASTFVICSANSTAQVEAIANGVVDKVRQELGEKPFRIEGMGNSVWVVIDYFDVMVHVFQTDLRDFYKLEELWADAPTTKYGENE